MRKHRAPTKLYSYHVANLRSLQQAMDISAVAIRGAIAEENRTTAESLTRLYAFLLGAWAETRLHKLLNESGAFPEPDKTCIHEQPTQIDKWRKIIELCFRRHYGIPRAKLDESTLPHSAFSRHETLVQLVNENFRPVIEVRNKLAHGQWIYPLNNSCTAVVTKQYEQINSENLLSLQFKRALLCSMSSALHDLVVSVSTFDRDFDRHYDNIVGTLVNLRTREFSDYQDGLVAKHRRGVAKRRGC